MYIHNLNRIKKKQSFNEESAKKIRPQVEQESPNATNGALDVSLVQEYLIPDFTAELFKSSDIDEEFDKQLACDMLFRNEQLMLTQQQQFSIFHMVNALLRIVESYMIIPVHKSPELNVEYVKAIGSYANDTMYNRSNMAEVIVIFTRIPTEDIVMRFGKQVFSDLMQDVNYASVEMEFTDFGISYSTQEAKVLLLIGTVPSNYPHINNQASIKLKMLIDNEVTLRRTSWFCANCEHPAIKVLVRVFKDIAARFNGMSPLNSWVIEVLAHYCYTRTSHVKLPLSAAFKLSSLRRILSLLAMNALSVECQSFVDPCNPSMFIHSEHSYGELVSVTMTAHMLLNLVAVGGHKIVFGMEEPPEDFNNGNFYYNGIKIRGNELICNESDSLIATQLHSLIKDQGWALDNEYPETMLANSPNWPNRQNEALSLE